MKAGQTTIDVQRYYRNRRIAATLITIIGGLSAAFIGGWFS